MEAEETETIDSAVSGKTVVITGTLPTLGRKEAAELVEKYGGKSIRIRIEKDRLCCCRRECGQQTGKGTGTWNHGAHGSRTVCTAWNQRRE